MDRPVPRLHLITDDGVVARQDFLYVARGLIAAAGSRMALHLRARRTGGAKLHFLAAELARAAREAGSICIVNDRADVALAAGCDGVHLGADPMSVQDARKLMGPRAVVGVSVHSAEEAMRAAGERPAFLIAGMLFASESHPEKSGSGVAWLRELEPEGPPVVGIGGITPERVDAVLKAGAHGVAVLGGIWRAPSPASALDSYLKALEAA